MKNTKVLSDVAKVFKLGHFSGWRFRSSNFVHLLFDSNAWKLLYPKWNKNDWGCGYALTCGYSCMSFSKFVYLLVRFSLLFRLCFIFSTCPWIHSPGCGFEGCLMKKCLKKNLLRNECLGRVFRRRKREHAVCQDYWERFVFPANVKPFVFQYELFMPRVPRFVFLQKETIATFGHKLNLPSPCEILRLSNGKSVSRKKNILWGCSQGQKSYLICWIGFVIELALPFLT